MSYVNLWNKKVWHLPKVVWVLILIIFSCSEKSSKSKSDPKINYPLSKEIENLTRSIKSNFDDSIVNYWNSFSVCLDSLANEIKLQITASSNPLEIVNVVKKTVFHDLNISFDKDVVISNYLPHLVYKSRSGSCVGIGLLILLLAERLEVPLCGVLIPTHFFVRYDNGTCRINIEPIKFGETFDDAWYLSKYNIDKHSIQSNLTNSQVVAVIHYSVGNIFLMNKKPDLAITQYQEALKLWPSFTDAIGNLSVALDLLGNYEEALKVLSTIKDDCSNTVILSKNRGALLLKNGLYKKAIKEYTELLKKKPNDPEILYNLGVSYFYLNKHNDAKKYFKLVLEIKPDLENAKKLITLCK